MDKKPNFRLDNLDIGVSCSESFDPKVIRNYKLFKDNKFEEEKTFSSSKCTCDRICRHCADHCSDHCYCVSDKIDCKCEGHCGHYSPPKCTCERDCGCNIP